ncbi:TetR/AcrR family transcriptional regulator [Gammaproteobacteria bacterium]|nr:TetR/AcrR family transcriptional regulator [Gammaproteobacteria bacterium]
MNKKTDKASTPQRILDSAEALFAESGYDGVSLRMITKLAGVELALPNYHFGSKLGLFRAVIQRRSVILNNERMEALNALSDKAEIEDLIEAFIGPFLRRSLFGGEGWRDYARVVAQIANSPRWTSEIMSAEFDPVAIEFIRRIRVRFPVAKTEDVYWSFHFLLGAMTMTFAQTGRIDLLSGDICHGSDLSEIHLRMVPFLSAGFCRLCKGST